MHHHRIDEIPREKRQIQNSAPHSVRNRLVAVGVCFVWNRAKFTMVMAKHAASIQKVSAHLGWPCDEECASRVLGDDAAVPFPSKRVPPRRRRRHRRRRR